MSTKTINIRVNPAMIRQLNEQGYKLCFASGVQSGGNVKYNVYSNITIQWEDSYAIADSSGSFRPGSKVTAATEMADINLGQSYTLPQDFTNGTINNDSSAPKDSIRFVNETRGAAAILYKKINGQNAPIYINTMAPLSPGTEDITPLSRVAVWFQNGVESSVMISDFPGNYKEVEMSFTTEATLEFNSEGLWVQV